MKIKIDSCVSNMNEFYGTIYPESEKERKYLMEMIEINESEKIKIAGVKE